MSPRRRQRVSVQTWQTPRHERERRARRKSRCPPIVCPATTSGLDKPSRAEDDIAEHTGREVTDMEEIWDLGQVDAEADEFDVLGNKSY
jgi:hypothetical protein